MLRGNIAGLQINYSNGQNEGFNTGSSSFPQYRTAFHCGGTEYNSLEEANNAVSVEDIREVEIKKMALNMEMKGERGYYYHTDKIIFSTFCHENILNDSS